MRAILPYPLLALGLALMWLLLGGFTPGHAVLSVIVAVGATHALGALGETSPRIRRWLAIPELLGIVLYDIVRSNIAVAAIILAGRRRTRRSGFLRVPIRLKSPSGLAVLAIVLTSTPGTAWLDYNSARGELLIHVFDLVDDETWLDLISNRYERLLLEIFE
jgi:multicomponent K+:H+ antiporter subunit E